MVIESETSALTLLMKKAFYLFYPDIQSQSNITLSAVADWPYDQYATPTHLISKSLTGLASTVIATPYSLGITYFSIATLLRSSIASLINAAGSAVVPSSSSLTLAALDLGISTDESRTMMTSLLDSSNPSSWPITFFAYLSLSDNTFRLLLYQLHILITNLHLYRRSIPAHNIPTRTHNV